MFERLFLSAERYRLGLIVVFNLCLVIAGYVLAAALRFDFDWNEVGPLLGSPLLALILYRTAAYIYWNLNQGYWRYTSTRELLAIIKAHLASSTALAATIAILRPPGFPRSVLFIEFVLSVLLQGGARMLVRMLAERFVNSKRIIPGQVRDVLVLGAGDSGHLLIKNLIQQPRLSYRAIGVLDDSENLQGMAVFGVRVIGKLNELRDVLGRCPSIAAVILAIPSLSPVRADEIEEVCREVNVPLKRLQTFEDIACIDVVDQRDPLSIEAMLQREVSVEHDAEVRRELRGKRVLITGAGGSIGSELVRQVLAFEPSSITLLDNSEYNLYRIERELRAYPLPVRKRISLTNIVDEVRLLRLLLEERPEVIFHAAAYKHVPLLEDNGYHAFVNNVIGTRNLVKAAIQADVRHLVMISTDKAVEPQSLMGCTKRIAEMLVHEYWESTQADGARGFSTSIVRFGNVINSNGSVVPLFREQILSGGPVTVTHPDMERYFMSIREAVRLVLIAGILGEAGEIYILDMGKPIKIVDVAKKMLALYGRRDIPIVFTGVRPGEKLTEELYTLDEQRQGTRFRKINRLTQQHKPEVAARKWVMELEALLATLCDEEIAGRMRAFVARMSCAHKERAQDSVHAA